MLLPFLLREVAKAAQREAQLSPAVNGGPAPPLASPFKGLARGGGLSCHGLTPLVKRPTGGLLSARLPGPRRIQESPLDGCPRVVARLDPSGSFAANPE